MAKCDLTLELDDPDRAFSPGDTIAGRVRVRADADCRCDALKIELQYHTHGKGNVVSDTIAEQTLFTGEWRSGASTAYPFSIPVPPGWQGSAGELLNVGFRLRATADIPWAFDPEVTEEVVLAAPRDAGLRVTWEPEKLEETQLATAPLLGCSVATLLLGAGLVAGTLASQVPHAIGGCSCLLFGGGLIATLGFGRSWLAQRRVGIVRAWLEQRQRGGYREASATDALDVRIGVKPGAPVGSVSARLLVQERVRRGSGTSKKTFTHELHADTAWLEPTGEPGLYAGRIPLPVAGRVPYSFSAPDNHVEWFVEAHVSIEGWPDWKETIPLQAAPAA